MSWPEPEHAYLLTLLRCALGHGGDMDPAPLSSDGLDWEKLRRLAEHHGVAALLHHHFEQHPAVPIPRQVRKAFADAYLRNSVLGLFHWQALQRLLQAFGAAGIPLLVHKGLGLATLLYQPPELRPAGGDIDLFVQPARYRDARQTLEALGYRLMDARRENHDLRYIGEVKFAREESGRQVVVDLHTDFIANHWGKVSGFEMRGFWHRLLYSPYEGSRIPCLPPEPYLFFLAIHCAANHVFERLIFFCDLDLFIRKFAGELNWSYLENYARATLSTKALYYPLRLCRELLGTPVPVATLEGLKPGPFSDLLMPWKRLLYRTEKPPKSLERHVHLLLLDNPLHIFRSVRIFLSRVSAERRMGKQPPA